MNLERDDIRKLLRDFVDNLITENYVEDDVVADIEVMEEAIENFMDDHEDDFIDFEEDK